MGETWNDQQGRYLVTLPPERGDLPEKLVLHVKRHIDEAQSALSSRIFAHIRNTSSGTDYLRLPRIVPLANDTLVGERDGYKFNFTTYHNGEHIKGPATRGQIMIVARGLALARNALSTLPDDVQEQVKKNTMPLHESFAQGAAFLDNNIHGVADTIRKGLGAEQFTKLQSLVKAYQSALDNATCHHADAISANMVIDAPALVLLDHEDCAAGYYHPLYDEGLALYRVILDSTKNPTLESDREMISLFLSVYNKYAQTKISAQELAKAAVLACTRNVLNVSRLAAEAVETKDFEKADWWIGGMIRRYGVFPLSAQIRIDSALNERPAARPDVYSIGEP